MRKIALLITFFLFTILLSAQVSSDIVSINKQDSLLSENTSTSFQPMYMQVPILKDYRINQPIKEVIRWGSIGWTPGYIYLLSTAHYDDPNIAAALMSMSGITVGSIYGLISGLYKSKAYNKEELSFHARKLKWGHELRVTGSKFDQCHRSGAGYYFFSKNDGFVDKVSIGYSFIKLSNSVKIQNGDTFENDVKGVEKRYLVEVEKSILKYGPFALSCAIGAGYSEGRLNRETYFNNFNLQTAVGMEFNIVDLFYIKPIVEYDLLGFRNDLSKHYQFSSINYLSFGCAIGSDIF